LNTHPKRSTRFVFGPFEISEDEHVLRKGGIRVRLSGQPVQILLYLLENAGEIVTRERLRGLVWGAGTYVDFEHGLDVAMNKLRRVLSDSPDEPKYIQTVAGRGYRFISPVERVEPNENSAPVLAELHHAEPAIASPEIRPPKPFSGWGPWLVGAGALLAVVLASWIFYPQNTSRARGVSTNRLPVVLGEWSNSTGDPTIAQTVRQALATQLESSSTLGPLTDSQIQNTLRLMRKAPDSPLTSPVAAEVCERTGGVAVLEGWVAKVGSQFLLGVRARNCANEEIFHEDEKQVNKLEDVAAALASTTPRLEQRLAQVPRPTPLPQLTTKSLDALKAYDAGSKALNDRGVPAAMPLFERAVELDPEFAFAHSHLGRAYSDLGEQARALESITLAYRLRQIASGQESFFITYNYRREVLRNLELARQTCEAWIRSYPNDQLPHSFLSGLTSQGTGQFERAVLEGRRSLQINPHAAIATLNVLTAHVSLDQLPEARAVLNEAAAKGMNLMEFSLYRYFLSFLAGDEAAMASESRSRQSITDAQGFFEHQEAFTLAYYGRLREAQALERQAIQIARQSRLLERAATFEGGLAVVEALYGMPAQAKQSSEEALRIARGRDTDFGPLFALSALRDKRAESMVQDLARRYPEDTPVQFQYLPTLKALLALNRGDAPGAVEFSQVPANYEAAFSGTSYCFFGTMYPAYMRGLAELQLHHYDSAASDFHKILAHPGLLLNDPVGALTKLQLARALAGSGNHAKARSAYLDFLNLWKNADPDLSVLHEAQAELKQF
jgi:DNA-binding winged helix-turn-helix (wHTH) protein